MNKSNEEQLNKTGNDVIIENKDMQDSRQLDQKPTREDQNDTLKESPRVKVSKLQMLDDSDEINLIKQRFNEKTRSVDYLDGIIKQETTYAEESINVSKSETLQLSLDHKKFNFASQQNQNKSQMKDQKVKVEKDVGKNSEKNNSSQRIKENQDIIKEIKNISPKSAANGEQFLLDDLQELYSKESFRQNQIPAQTKSEPDAEQFSLDKRLESLENQDKILGDLEQNLIEDLKNSVVQRQKEDKSKKQREDEENKSQE